MTEATDIMRGFPPPDATKVTLDNWRNPPFNRWSFHHVSQIVPCAVVWPGDKKSTAWNNDTRDIETVSFKWKNSQLTVSEMLQRTFTDGFIVLHEGRLIHESYDSGLHQHLPHILFSVTKSVLGLIAGVLVESGQLNVNRQIIEIIPEVSGSGYADATVRQLIDMTAGVAFDEDYLAPTGDMARYREASGWNVGDPAHAIGLRKFVATIPGGYSHGQAFRYCSPSIDLFAWILERVSDQPLYAFLSSYLWAPMGATDIALIAVDGESAPRGSGGLCTSTRDLARIGELVLNLGAVGTRQIVPEYWIEDIQAGGSVAAWSVGSFAHDIPDATYRACWYRYGTDDWSMGGFGIYGQALYIHPASRTVFAKVSSYPTPLDFELEGMQRAAFQAIAQELS